MASTFFLYLQKKRKFASKTGRKRAFSARETAAGGERSAVIWNKICTAFVTRRLSAALEILCPNGYNVYGKMAEYDRMAGKARPENPKKTEIERMTI